MSNCRSACVVALRIGFASMCVSHRRGIGSARYRHAGKSRRIVMADSSQVVCPHCGAVNRIPAERPAIAARCGGCHAALFDAHPVEVDEAGLDRHLRGNDIPVLVDIWAPWCGPCRVMAPQFERAAAALEPQLRLLKLNADTAPDTCARLGVRGIPAMYLFRNGHVVTQTAGAMNADAIVRWARDGLTTHNQ
jgi:thioredoxin 2